MIPRRSKRNAAQAGGAGDTKRVRFETPGRSTRTTSSGAAQRPRTPGLLGGVQDDGNNDDNVVIEENPNGQDGEEEDEEEEEERDDSNVIQLTKEELQQLTARADAAAKAQRDAIANKTPAQKKQDADASALRRAAAQKELTAWTKKLVATDAAIAAFLDQHGDTWPVPNADHLFEGMAAWAKKHGSAKPSLPLIEATEEEQRSWRVDRPEYLDTLGFYAERLRALYGWHSPSDRARENKDKELRGEEVKDDGKGTPASTSRIKHAGLVMKFAVLLFYKNFRNDDVWDHANNDGEAATLLLNQAALNPHLKTFLDHLVMAEVGVKDDWFGWKKWFLEPWPRVWLVAAIIGTVLREHVFDSLFFGGTEEQIQELEIDETASVMNCEDGFSRIASRAAKIRAWLDASPTGWPLRYKNAVRAVSASILTLLQPFFTLLNLPDGAIAKHPTELTTANFWSSTVEKVTAIVGSAGRLSVQMRLDGSTYFHFTDALPFDPIQRAEVYIENDELLRRTNKIWLAARTADFPDTPSIRPQDARLETPIVNLALAPGVSAYKPGGWLREERASGVRAMQLTVPTVVGRWDWLVPRDFPREHDARVHKLVRNLVWFLNGDDEAAMEKAAETAEMAEVERREAAGLGEGDGPEPESQLEGLVKEAQMLWGAN